MQLDAIEAYLGTRILNPLPTFMGIAARTRTSTIVEPEVTEGTVVLRKGEQIERRTRRDGRGEDRRATRSILCSIERG